MKLPQGLNLTKATVPYLEQLIALGSSKAFTTARMCACALCVGLVSAGSTLTCVTPPTYRPGRLPGWIQPQSSLPASFDAAVRRSRLAWVPCNNRSQYLNQWRGEPGPFVQWLAVTWLTMIAV